MKSSDQEAEKVTGNSTKIVIYMNVVIYLLFCELQSALIFKVLFYFKQRRREKALPSAPAPRNFHNLSKQ